MNQYKNNNKNGNKNNQARCKTKWYIAVPICITFLLGMTFLAGCSARTETSRNWPTDDTIIRLYQHESGMVEELPLEEYLCGVLAGEMDNTWPEEALQAQAILARTFTLEKMGQGAMREYNADASTDIHAFQAYDAEKINEAIREAVDDTENEVVVHNGELIKAWFFSDGGGITASSAKEGLSYDKEETPYIRSVKDPGAGHPENPNTHWRAAFSMAETAEAIASVTGVTRDGYQSVVITERGDSGRVITYQFDNVAVGAAALRLALGGEEMKSNLVDAIEIRDDMLYVQGKGYGHGVGMSQWGARALAEQGKSAEDIIRYFFRDIKIIETDEQ